MGYTIIPVENRIVEILRSKRTPISDEELLRQLRSINLQISPEELKSVLMKMELLGVIKVYSRKGNFMIELVRGDENGG